MMTDVEPYPNTITELKAIIQGQIISFPKTEVLARGFVGFGVRQHIVLSAKVSDAYANVDREHVLAQLCQALHPNRYLASFARFMTEHQDRPDVLALLNQAFGAFAATALRPLRECSAQVALVGSVAYHFEPHLGRAIAAERMELVRVVRDPIEPLIAFHAQA